MNKLAWLEAVARQFFHLINIAVVIDLINPYHFLSNETKLKLGFAYFKYVWDTRPIFRARKYFVIVKQTDTGALFSGH